jgi:hypothetical protein
VKRLRFGCAARDDLNLPPPADALARLRIFEHRVVSVNLVLRLEVVRIGGSPVAIQSGSNLSVFHINSLTIAVDAEARKSLVRFQHNIGRDGWHPMRSEPRSRARPIEIALFDLSAHARGSHGSRSIEARRTAGRPQRVNLRHDRLVPTGPLNPNLPPLQTDSRAAGLRHKRIFVSARRSFRLRKELI